MPATVASGNTIAVSKVVAELGPFKPVVFVDATHTVAQAVATMCANDLVSAPVRDENVGTICGVVNMLEIFTYVGLGAVSEAKMQDPVMRVLEANPDTANMWLVDINDKLPKVMAAFRKGIHRVLVTSAADPALLLSQSDVIKFLNSHMELVNADESIATGLGFVANDGTDPMTTIADTLTAEEAFVILAGSERSACPIVNAEGQIVGTVSVSDLRRVMPGADLSTNVLAFLAEKNARGAGAPVTVHESAKIGEIMIPLAYSGVHRVWVVDAKKRPVGVVSMSDVIDKVASAGNL